VTAEGNTPNQTIAPRIVLLEVLDPQDEAAVTSEGISRFVLDPEDEAAVAEEGVPRFVLDPEDEAAVAVETVQTLGTDTKGVTVREIQDLMARLYVCGAVQGSTLNLTTIIHKITIRL